MLDLQLTDKIQLRWHYLIWGGPGSDPHPQLLRWGCVFPVQGSPHPPCQTWKRKKLAEAAERRQMKAASWGILDVQLVEEKRKKKEKLERQMATSGPPSEGGLRWTVS